MQIEGVGLARAYKQTAGARPGRRLLAIEKLIAWNSVRCMRAIWLTGSSADWRSRIQRVAESGRHRINTTEEENRQGRGEPSRQYRKWGMRTPKDDENQIEPMRKADTRQSKTKIGITSIGRMESGALCLDRREEKSG
jgi:hypothetical protein